MTAYPNECCTDRSYCVCSQRIYGTTAGPAFITQDSRRSGGRTVAYTLAALAALVILALLFATWPAKAGIMWTPWGWSPTPVWAGSVDNARTAWSPAPWPYGPVVWRQPPVPPVIAPLSIAAPLPPVAVEAGPDNEEVPHVNPANFKLVTHNGSLMRIEDYRAAHSMVIAYEEPRPGLAAVGVSPGTILVEGSWSRNGAFRGTAYLFHPCGPLPYGVTGRPVGPVLVLKGPTPVVSPDCRIIGNEWTGNSELTFVPIKGGFAR